MIDRQPPHSADAERSVLGGMLLNKDAVYTAVEIIGGATDAFYIEQHRAIYAAMFDLSNRNMPLDPVLLSTHLPEKCGGMVYLAELTSAVPTSANADIYAELIMDKYRQRCLIDIGTKAVRQSYNGDNWREIAAEIERGVYGVMAGETQDTTAHIRPVAATALADMLRDAPDGITGLSSGIRPLDALTGGFKRSDMIVLAARPSVGKTALALNIVAHVCRGGNACMFFSLEMAKEQLANRLLCLVGGVDSSRLKTGFLRKQETPKLEAAFREVETWPLEIDDKAGIGLLELKAKALRQASKQPLGLVVIDYLQLVTAPRCENRQVEVAEISKQIKSLARDLRCPVLALSQLSRGPESRGDGKPRLSDLRESGAIEQDADVVLMMAKSVGSDSQIVECAIAKQRNGPTGEFNLAFLKDRQQFRESGEAPRGYQPPPEQNYSAPGPAYQNDPYDDDDENPF